MHNDQAQYFENHSIGKMMHCEPDPQGNGVRQPVCQFNQSNGLEHAPQIWTPTLEQPTGTYTFSCAANANLLEHDRQSSGRAAMGLDEYTGSTNWLQRWIVFPVNGSESGEGVILACAAGTGCLTADANSADMDQLRVEGYFGKKTQLWTSALVSGGAWPESVVGFGPSSALGGWLCEDSSIENVMAGGGWNYTYASLLFEIYRSGFIRTTTNSNGPIHESWPGIVQHLTFWLTEYFPPYGGTPGADPPKDSERAKQKVEAAATKAQTASTSGDWGEVENDLDTEGFKPPQGGLPPV